MTDTPVPADPRRFVQQAVAACLVPVLRNVRELSAGSRDPEHVHQLRVGLRRLRTALRELPEFNARLDPGWEPVLAHTFRELGKHRDQALLASKTSQALWRAGAPALEADAAATGSSPSPASLARARPLEQALKALSLFSVQPTGSDASAFEGDTLDAVGVRLDKLHRQVRKSATGFAEMPAEEQHAARKRLKRLRYLAEFIAPAYRRSKVSAYFDALKPAQDALGEHNDEATALDHFRARTARHPEAWFAVGWLTARQEVSADAAARALKKAGKAEPFWRTRPKKQD